MSFRKTTLAFALVSCSCLPGSAADVKVIAGDPNTVSRTVTYHETDIIPISTEIRFTTLIELPKEESILEVTCGDKEYWPVNWTGNLAYVKPAKPGGRTNINLITASGNVYSFLATEVSQDANGHADLKMFVTPSDTSAVVAMKDNPRFIPADSVAVYKTEAEEARAQLAAQQSALRQEFQKEEAELRAEYPATIKHDYKYTVPAKDEFHIRAIYHDDRFTYIEAEPQEAPSVYEIKDGKPNLIQYTFKDGRYTIPKILDDGYLRVGKSELKFHRENAG